MILSGMSIEEAKMVMIAYARENIIANTRVGIAFQTALRELDKIEDRPKGKWRTNRVHGGIVKCDFCGFQWGSNEGRKFNYCPNCGADMRGAE